MRKQLKNTVFIALFALALSGCGNDSNNYNASSPATDAVEATLAEDDSSSIIDKLTPFVIIQGKP